MRSSFKVTFRASAMAAATFAGLAASQASADSWRGWNIHPEGYPNSVALDAFATDVAKGTDGRLELTVYHGGVLGSQPDAIEQARHGALDFANFNMGPMGEFAPTANILSLPFLFNDVAHMHRVMDGPIGAKFSAALEENGLVALSWFDSGSRSFYNTRQPIRTPADLDGMKFRVMNNDLYVQMVDKLGGNATPMAYGEVYQALKTGVIDGAENNYPSFDSSNHFEVAKYYSITNHLILPECLCISKASWDKLSDADKGAVRDAAVSAAKLQRELWAERSGESRKKVEASGVSVNEVEDISAFQAAMAPIHTTFVEKHPELGALIGEIRATQ